MFISFIIGGENSPGEKKIPYARNASQLEQLKNEYLKDNFFKKYMISLINHNGSLEPIMVYYKKKYLKHS